VHLLIDSDPLVYRAGFAAEKLCRGLVYSIAGDDGIYEKIFSPNDEGTALQQLNKFLEENDDVEELDRYDEVVPEPVENALATVKHMIRDCLYQAQEHFKLGKDEVRYTCFLSGPGNFREGLATVVPYKGNRKVDHKPYHYSAIRNYLQEVHGAVVIEGREADDAVAIRQYEKPGETCICTFDKDLDQVPGWHYDYNKFTFYYTEEDEGKALFFQQVLSGDATDNIPGCYRIGKAKAEKIVQEYLLEHPADWKGLWKVIVEVYEKSVETHGVKCPYWQLYTEGGAETVALEMARLVKMQEYEEQLWCPPGTPDLLMLEDMEDDKD
jgi:hypothetical protein